MKIAVIGVGYVGLISGVCLAQLGFEVTCIDTDLNKIKDLQNGIIPIYEPGLQEIYLKQITNKKLQFTHDYKLLREKNIVFLTVGTPCHEENGTANLSFLKNAISTMLPFLSSNTLIVIKSTVPPGTSKEIADFIKKNKPNLEFHMVSNPEFLRQGNAVKDFYYSDRVVIGTNSKYAEDKMRELYSYFIRENIPLIFTDIETAELIKYASNSFLATKIAYINEMANICEQTGTNIDDLIKGIGLDHRIGTPFLQPGPGFGGSCFPKDLKAFAEFARSRNATSEIIEAVIKSNTNRKLTITNKIEKACGGNLKNNVIGILGVTFKANTDDVRESPSIKIMEELIRKNALIKVYDPLGMNNAKKALPDKNITWCDECYEVAKDANALVITTEWEEFKNLNPVKIKEIMKSPLVLDLRNILNEKLFKTTGVIYRKIGRAY